MTNTCLFSSSFIWLTLNFYYFVEFTGCDLAQRIFNVLNATTAHSTHKM
jgi:hypothetical protein